MPSSTLIIGGYRSGKSRHALNLADNTGDSCNLFVATCIPQDQEMAERVKRHQRERGSHWQTVETPHDLATTICKTGSDVDLLLIDCLTLWISNLMMIHDDDKDVLQHIDHLVTAIRNAPCPIIVVSNEVGTGIVPENALARRFRDLCGWCNQKVAATVHRVIWMVAGIAVTIKESP